MTKWMDTVRQALGVEKRAGLYVYRPVLNGQEWHDWATKHGVPNPLAADDFHVTVLYSTKDVKMAADPKPMVISTGGDGMYCCFPGSFCMLGPKDDVFTFCFDAYTLQDRNWAFLRNGGESKWPTYRPHMTIGKDASDFEISDEAMADAPLYIILGGEEFAALKVDDQAEDSEANPEGETDDVDVVIIIDVVAKAAEKALESAGALTPFDRSALRDMSTRKVISKPVAKRLAEADWAPDEFKALVEKVAEPAPVNFEIPGETRKSKELVLPVGDLPEQVAKMLGTRRVAKTEDEERMMVGIASVSTVKGELVVDHHGDTITTQTLIEFTRDIIRNGRAGKFDHQGEACNEIVQAFVLSDDIQKSLGIDLGFEPMLIEMHVPGDKEWSLVKSGDWMFSIAGTLYYVDDEE